MKEPYDVIPWLEMKTTLEPNPLTPELKKIRDWATERNGKVRA